MTKSAARPITLAPAAITAEAIAGKSDWLIPTADHDIDVMVMGRVIGFAQGAFPVMDYIAHPALSNWIARLAETSTQLSYNPNYLSAIYYSNFALDITYSCADKLFNEQIDSSSYLDDMWTAFYRSIAHQLDKIRFVPKSQLTVGAFHFKAYRTLLERVMPQNDANPLNFVIMQITGPVPEDAPQGFDYEIEEDGSAIMTGSGPVWLASLPESVKNNLDVYGGGDAAYQIKIWVNLGDIVIDFADGTLTFLSEGSDDEEDSDVDESISEESEDEEDDSVCFFFRMSWQGA